jgi:hypothetical protein
MIVVAMIFVSYGIVKRDAIRGPRGIYKFIVNTPN